MRVIRNWIVIRIEVDAVIEWCAVEGFVVTQNNLEEVGEVQNAINAKER